jgi:hypothetical protein
MLNRLVLNGCFPSSEPNVHEQFLQFVEKNTSLIKVVIQGSQNQVLAETSIHFIQSVKTSKSIKDLDISYHFIHEGGIKELGELIRNRPDMEDIVFDCSRCTFITQFQPLFDAVRDTNSNVRLSFPFYDSTSANCDENFFRQFSKSIQSSDPKEPMVIGVLQQRGCTFENSDH